MTFANLIPNTPAPGHEPTNPTPATGPKPLVHVLPPVGMGGGIVPTALRGIPASKLKRLVSHADQTATAPHLRPWQYSHFLYGEPNSYNSIDRLRDAGILPEELAAAGLRLQSDTHGRYTEISVKDPNGAAARRESYLIQHHRAPIDYRISPKNNPTGIGPRVVPGGVTANQMMAWHALFTTMVMNAKDDELVVCPPIVTGDGTGQVVPGLPNANTPPPVRVRGCPEFMAFHTEYQRLLTGITGVLAHLKAGEDRTFLGPLTEAFEKGVSGLPLDDLAKVQDAHFDPTVIRVGVMVTINPTSGGAKLAKALATKAGLGNPPAMYEVMSIEKDRAMLKGDGIDRTFPVALTELARVVTRTLAKPAPTPNWTPSLGDRVVYAGREGSVLEIAEGGICTLFLDDGGEEVVESHDPNLKPA